MIDPVRFYEIEIADLANVLPKQFGYQTVNDSDLETPVVAYKDSSNVVHKLLEKDKNIRINDLTVLGNIKNGQAIVVPGNGTDLENGTSLLAAIAAVGTPTADKPSVIVLTAGNIYNIAALQLSLDTDYLYIISDVPTHRTSEDIDSTFDNVVIKAGATIISSNATATVVIDSNTGIENIDIKNTNSGNCILINSVSDSIFIAGCSAETDNDKCIDKDSLSLSEVVLKDCNFKRGVSAGGGNVLKNTAIYGGGSFSESLNQSVELHNSIVRFESNFSVPNTFVCKNSKLKGAYSVDLATGFERDIENSLIDCTQLLFSGVPATNVTIVRCKINISIAPINVIGIFTQNIVTSTATTGDGTLLVPTLGSNDTVSILGNIINSQDEDSSIYGMSLFDGKATISNNVLSDIIDLNETDFLGVNNISGDFIMHGRPVYADSTLEPTGFTDPSNVVVTYNSGPRTISLSGNVKAYYRGKVVKELVSGWVSESHVESPTSTLFLKYNGTGFSWSYTPWNFSETQISYVCVNGVGVCFAQREPHGLMERQSHKEFHEQIGTYRTSGGDIGGITLLSTTEADRRPTFSECNVSDEDLDSSLEAFTTKTNYTQFYVTSTETPNISKANDDIVPLSTNRPYWNEFTGGSFQQTLMSNNSYMAVWVIAIPTTIDPFSSVVRFTFLQGQNNSSDIDDIRSLNFYDLNLGAAENLSPEFVAIEKIILSYTGGNWSIAENQRLGGSRALQIAGPSGSFLTTVTSDSTLGGAGTASSPLTVEAIRQLNDGLPVELLDGDGNSVLSVQYDDNEGTPENIVNIGNANTITKISGSFAKQGDPGQTTTSDNGTTTIKANDNVNQVANGNGDNHTFTFSDSESGNLWTIGQSKTLFNNSTEVVIAAGVNGSFFEFLVPRATATVTCTVEGVGTTEFEYKDDANSLPISGRHRVEDDWGQNDATRNRLMSALSYNSGSVGTIGPSSIPSGSSGGIGYARTDSSITGMGLHATERSYVEIGNGAALVQSKINLSNIGDSPDDYIAWVNLSDTNNSNAHTPANAIAIRWDSGGDSTTNPNFVGASFVAGVEDNGTFKAGVTPSTSVFQRLTIVINSTGTKANCYVNSTWIYELDVLPTGSLSYSFGLRGTGAGPAQRIMQEDYHIIHKNLSTKR